VLARKGCSPASGTAGGARARQARGARRLLATRQGVLQGVLTEQQAAVLANTALAPAHRCSPSAVPPLGHRKCCLCWGTGELHAPPPTSTPMSSSATMSPHSSKQ
jgi:hypothetical protein